MSITSIISIVVIASISGVFLVTLFACIHGDIKHAKQQKRLRAASADYTFHFGTIATCRLLTECRKYKVPTVDVIDIMESAVLSEERSKIYEH